MEIASHNQQQSELALIKYKKMKNLLTTLLALCLFTIQAQVKKIPNNPKDIGIATDGRKTVFQEMKEREVALRNVKTGGLTSQGNAKVFSKINPTKLGDYVSDWLPASDCFLGIYFKVKMKSNKDGTYDTTVYFKNNYNKEVYFNSSIIGNDFEKKYQPTEQFPEHMNIGFKENKLKAGEQSSSYTSPGPYINNNHKNKDLNIKITIFDVCFNKFWCTKNSSGYNPKGVDNGNKNQPCFAVCDKGSPNVPQKCGKGSDTSETGKVNTNDGNKTISNSQNKIPAFSEAEWQSLVNQYEELRSIEHSACLRYYKDDSEQNKNNACPIYKEGTNFDKSSWGINKLKSEIKGMQQLIKLHNNQY